MHQNIVGSASMGHSTLAISVSRKIFPAGFHHRVSHVLSRSPSSAGGTHWGTNRTSYRSPPFHSSADQAARNLCRPGGDRHRECHDCSKELKESLEQQTATSEILGVIASSPTDVQPVLDVVAETAARLCDAIDSLILRVEGDSLRLAAQYGSVASVFGFPHSVEALRLAELLLDCQTIHVHDLTEESEHRVPRKPETPQQRSGTRTELLVTPLLREGVAIGVIVIRRFGSSPFYGEEQIALQNLRRARRSSPSRTCDCSRNCRSATQSCAKRWSIRPQRPRCSASSAARPRTCSRCSTPSSRAPHEFVGLMTWCCDFTRGTLRYRGLILAPYPLGESRSVLMSHEFAGCASTAHSTFPTFRRRTNSQVGFRRRLTHTILSFRFVSTGKSLEP